MFARLAAALLAVLIATTAQAAPLEAYGRLPTLEQVLVSPDGTRLAYVQPEGESRKIVVQSLADGRMLASVGVGKEKLRDLLWVGNGHIAFSTSTTSRVESNSSIIVFVGRGEIVQTRIYDIEARSFQLVLNKIPSVGNFTLGTIRVRPYEGKPSLYVVGQRLSGQDSIQSLFRVDVAGGDTRMLDSGPAIGEVSTRWALGSDGELIARTEYNRKTGAWRLLKRDSSDWRTVALETAPLDEPWLIGMGSGMDTLLISRLEQGERVTRSYSLATEKFEDQLPYKNGVLDYLWDPVTNKVAGVIENSADQKVTYFSSEDQARWGMIKRAFPGEQVSPESWSDSHKQVVVRVEGTKTGAAYMFVDLASGRASLVGDLRAGIGPDEISSSSKIQYKAADGLMIEAILTLPKGREPKGLPLVVMPHGGPETFDVIGFDWWAQALASRGYAVLQPNFRGSSGYGQGFTAAGYGEWGRKMQTDVSDGVKYLGSKGTIDPKRVCIAGASYGGYAALAGVALEPDVYRCAVSVAGISDLRKMLVWIRGRVGGEANPATRYWRRFMGVEGRDESGLAAYSPASQVAAIRAPVLLIHGKDDLVVPYEQSQLLANAMKAAGKPVELVTLREEDHWLSREATRLQMLKATVEFLEANNPPQ